VLKTFEADPTVGRSAERIRLLQADKLLDVLASNYRPPKAVERYVGKVAMGEHELLMALGDGTQHIKAKLVRFGRSSQNRHADRTAA
jgi:hypothetical protein